MEESPLPGKGSKMADMLKRLKSAPPRGGSKKSVSPRDMAVEASPSWEKKAAAKAARSPRPHVTRQAEASPSWEKKAAAKAARSPRPHVTRQAEASPSWEKKTAAEAARRPCLHVTR